MVSYPRPKPTFIVAAEAVDEVYSEDVFSTSDGQLLKPDEYVEAFHSYIRENPEQVETIRILLERVDRALERLLAGRNLTSAQQKWLGLIRRHLIANLAIERGDFELLEFAQQGATWGRVDRAFGGGLEELLGRLNAAVAG